ncbi:MAG: HipA N-terminal domain-containing protein [Bacteroidales bacterium]|nr:HipA N-terminal domain-containing protein [Bacteroidales bacterium]
MKKADVFYRETKVGQLVEDENGYSFCYDEDYLTSGNAEPISLTLPLTSKPYQSSTMFPFFDGLIPEGWLLDVASKNWKLNPNDRMGLLMTCCKDCIGAIGIIGLEEAE